jgi:hypothetical protein
MLGSKPGAVVMGHVKGLTIGAGTSIGGTIVSLCAHTLPVIQWIAAFIAAVAGIVTIIAARRRRAEDRRSAWPD